MNRDLEEKLSATGFKVTPGNRVELHKAFEKASRKSQRLAYPHPKPPGMYSVFDLARKNKNWVGPPEQPYDPGLLRIVPLSNMFPVSSDWYVLIEENERGFTLASKPFLLQVLAELWGKDHEAKADPVKLRRR